MGVDYSSAKKLIHHASRHGISGSVLMLGRHRMQLKEKFRPALDKELEKAGYNLDCADLEQQDGYAERFFTTLGAQDVQSLDLSDFEGASILHDMNETVPEELTGQFDLIYDGGTTEHIFDVATCMNNLNSLLAPNGVLVSCVPANNWFAHGFYQFGPELVYGYWKHGCGFDVLQCVMLPELPRDKEMAIADPAEKGHRPRVRGRMPSQRCYLYYEVKKGPNAHGWNRALQTDYVRKWSDFDISQSRNESEIVALRSEQMSAERARERV